MDILQVRYKAGGIEYAIEIPIGSGEWSSLETVVRGQDIEIISPDWFAEVWLSQNTLPNEASLQEWSYFTLWCFKQYIRVVTHEGILVTGEGHNFRIIGIRDRFAISLPPIEDIHDSFL